MPYVDTSVLVAAFTREVRTATAQRWLAAQAPERLLISDWTRTEFSAALSMKSRMGQLDAAVRAQVLKVFAALVSDTLTVLAVTAEDFSLAARLADQHASGLRAGDALHLAVASRSGEPVVSLDRGLVGSARRWNRGRVALSLRMNRKRPKGSPGRA